MKVDIFMLMFRAKNNLAAQTTFQNIYMSFGGTNWGNLAEPTVYTSYVNPQST